MACVAVGVVRSINSASKTSFARGTTVWKVNATPASVRTVPSVSAFEVACDRA